MITDLFSPGDVLFYDKVNEGISNLSHEDSDTQMYFDYNQYVALGVVVAVDDISSTIKLITPAVTQFYLRNLQNCKDKEILTLMNEKIKEHKKFFNKECGRQSTVKFYIPNEDDINLLIENCTEVYRGCESLQYFCDKLIGTKFDQIVFEEQIGFIAKKKFKILLGGIESAIIDRKEKELKRIEDEREKQRLSDYDRQFGLRPGTEIHYAFEKETQDIDDFYLGKNKKALKKDKNETSDFEKRDISDMLLPIDDLQVQNNRVTIEDLVERFPKLEQVVCYSIPFMSILIN